MGNDGRYIIGELRASIDFLQRNWTDEIGQEMNTLLQEKEAKLKEIETRRDTVCLNLSMLEQRVKRLLEEDDDYNAPPVKTLRRTPQDDGFYPSGGGRSRTR